MRMLLLAILSAAFSGQHNVVMRQTESIRVAAFARCDGTADDTLGLRAAIATGRPLVFPAGATCRISGMLTLQAGQTMDGNGATLKAVDQIETTTSTTITTETNVIVVADASSFRVGMDINFMTSTTFDGTGNRRISAIDGNTITTSTTWGTGTSGTTTIYTQFYMLQLLSDSSIRNLTLDGNRAAVSYGRWQTTGALTVLGDRVSIEDVSVVDCPGEGAIVYGDFFSIQESHFRDLDGNAIHFSGSVNPSVDRVRILRANENTDVGHADGAVTWSNAVSDAKISGVYVDDSDVACFGSIDSSDVTAVEISGSTCRNTPTCIEGVWPASSASHDIIVQGNHFYDCDIVFSRTSDTGTPWPGRIIFAGNYWEGNTDEDTVQFQRVENVIVDGNVFRGTGTSTGAMVFFNRTNNLRFSANVIVGSDVGTWSQDPVNLAIVNNQWINQIDYAIGFSASAVGPILIAGNYVSNDSASTSSYYGVNSFGSVTMRGNEFNLAKGHSCIYARDGAIIQGNVCRHGSATYSIRADGGTSGIIIVNNQVTTAISDAGSNTARDNDVIP